MGKYFKKNDAGEFEEIEIDDAKELKEALVKERDAHKSVKERAKELEERQKQLEEDKLLKEKEFEKLWNSEKTAKELTAKELKELKDLIANKERESLASKIINPLTKDTTKAEILKKIALEFIQNTPDGMKMVGTDGTIFDESKLSAHLSDRYSFLVDGVDSSGSGAKGSKGGGYAGKKYSEMTEAEHKDLYSKDPEKFIKLRDAEKSR